MSQKLESQQGRGINLQADDAALVTTSDTTVFTTPSTLYIGVTGNVRVLTAKGTDILYSNVAVGFFPILVTKVFQTNTTASSIIRQW